MIKKINKKIKIAIIFFIFMITSLMLILFITYNDGMRLIRKQFNEQQSLIAQQTAIGIENSIKSLTRELFLLSEDSALKNMDIDKTRVVMARVFEYVKSFHVNDIALIDAKGILRANLFAPQLENKDFSYRKYYIHSKTLTKSSVVYEFIKFKGVETGQKGIVIAMPVFSPKNVFNGVVIFTIKIDDFLHGFAPVRLKNTKMWAIDNNGYILYHPDYESGTMFNSVSGIDFSLKKFLQNIKQSHIYMGSYLSPEGINVISASHSIMLAGEPIAVVIETSSSDISNLLSSFTKKFALSFLIVLIIVITTLLSIIYAVNNWNVELARQVNIRVLQLEKTQTQLIQAEKMRGVGILASGIAHEVKNPLTIILMGIDYIYGKLNNNSEVLSTLEEMKHAVEQADNTIRGLLDFSKSSKIEIKEENLNLLVDTSLRLIKHYFAQCNIKLIKQFQPDMPLVHVDINMFGQVLINIFTNAVYAMPHGGTLTVRTYKKSMNDCGKNIAFDKNSSDTKGELAILEIEDTGVGIPEDSVEDIFEPFFSTRHNKGGTGLGLSVVKNIIDMHEGYINIENKKQGPGVKVTIALKI